MEVGEREGNKKQCHCVFIKESVNSMYRDVADTQYMQHLRKRP